MKHEVVSLLPVDGRSALSQMAEGMQLLAVHQLKLSLARRACIKPTLNLLENFTTDLAPIDEWLVICRRGKGRASLRESGARPQIYSGNTYRRTSTLTSIPPILS